MLPRVWLRKIDDRHPVVRMSASCGFYLINFLEANDHVKRHSNVWKLHWRTVHSMTASHPNYLMKAHSLWVFVVSLKLIKHQAHSKGSATVFNEWITEIHDHDSLSLELCGKWHRNVRINYLPIVSFPFYYR